MFLRDLPFSNILLTTSLQHLAAVGVLKGEGNHVLYVIQDSSSLAILIPPCSMRTNGTCFDKTSTEINSFFPPRCDPSMLRCSDKRCYINKPHSFQSNMIMSGNPMVIGDNITFNFFNSFYLALL